jgi:tryptophanyl-tRNA synthetase
MFARCLRTGLRSLSTVSPITSAKQIIFSGIQPTGVPHLGNYLGALKNWVRLQETVDKEAKIFFSIVDLHAITVPVSPTDLRRDRDEMWYSLYAVGIDMERCIVFEQSAVLSPLP